MLLVYRLTSDSQLRGDLGVGEAAFECGLHLLRLQPPQPMPQGGDLTQHRPGVGVEADPGE